MIDWESTADGNVKVLNPHAEFVYACVMQMIEGDLPRETEFLVRTSIGSGILVTGLPLLSNAKGSLSISKILPSVSWLRRYRKAGMVFDGVLVQIPTALAYPPKVIQCQPWRRSSVG